MKFPHHKKDQKGSFSKYFIPLYCLLQCAQNKCSYLTCSTLHGNLSLVYCMRTTALSWALALSLDPISWRQGIHRKEQQQWEGKIPPKGNVNRGIIFWRWWHHMMSYNNDLSLHSSYWELIYSITKIIYRLRTWFYFCNWISSNFRGDSCHFSTK